MTVASSYSLESAPCPWGSGWRRAAPADASPAPSPADSAAAAAAAPDDALSLPVPAASSWPGAPVVAEKCAPHQSANREVSFKAPVNSCSIYFCWDGQFVACNMLLIHYLTTQTYLIFSVKMSGSAVPTLRCSWSWAWCWRVSFSCCFWNSLMSSCFWICCCFWMRSSSCCSCLSHSPGSEPGPSILGSVRRSNGDKGSTLSGTSDLTSTVGCRERKREGEKRFL